MDSNLVCSEIRLGTSEALNPVSPQALLRVKVPDGLDLDAWINDPMPEEATSFSHYDVCHFSLRQLNFPQEPWMDDDDPYSSGSKGYYHSGTGGYGPGGYGGQGSGGGFGGMGGGGAGGFDDWPAPTPAYKQAPVDMEKERQRRVEMQRSNMHYLFDDDCMLVSL